MKSIVFIILACTCPLLAATSDDVVSTRTRATISRYVARHQHWQRARYKIVKLPEDKIDRAADEKGLDFYVISYLYERSEPVVDAGKSFLVTYDPKADRVVKEYGLQ